MNPLQANVQALLRQNYLLNEETAGRPIRLFFQPLSYFFHQNLEALAILDDYLIQQSSQPICRMIRNREENFATDADGIPSVLMTLPEAPAGKENLGGILASFHLLTRGIDSRSFPESLVYQKTDGLSRILDAISDKYTEIDARSARDAFEKRFLNNFPYFSGCSENAIQYLVDWSTAYPSEPLVLTHYRFNGFHSLFPENPAAWVADDRSRDLAEWIRMLVWNSREMDCTRSVSLFLDQYEAVFPLSQPVAGKMFGRLLFPNSYIECCERYLFGSAYENRDLLTQVLATNEKKVGSYQQILAYLGKRYSDLKIPEWLTAFKSAVG